MKKKSLIPFFLFGLTLLLLGCHSQTKEEKYNAMPAEKIYLRGVNHLKKRQYEDAIEDFEALESRYPFGDYADKSQLGAFYAYYKDGDYPLALAAIERFIRMYPRHPHIDYAYYMKGLTHFSDAMGFFGKYFPLERPDRDQRASVKALNAFDHLITHYPNSLYVDDAKQRIIYLRELLAENELVAARFYLAKGAYLAAANRADYVLTHFDETRALPEALSIKVKAYRALELPLLADEAYRVLQFSFPHSRYLTDLEKK